MSRRFTLLDEAYFRALATVSDALANANVAFALVGGGAVQAWIASLRTEDGARRLSDEPVLRTALRRTRDLDFSTRADPADMLALLNEIAVMEGEGTHVLGARALRLGAVSVSLTLGPDDLSGMSGAYDALLDSRAVLHLRRGVEPTEVPTIGIAELLATKLTRRGDKAKDLLDIEQLVAALRDAGRSVDLEPARRLIVHDPAALALLDEIESRLKEQ